MLFSSLYLVTLTASCAVLSLAAPVHLPASKQDVSSTFSSPRKRALSSITGSPKSLPPTRPLVSSTAKNTPASGKVRLSVSPNKSPSNSPLKPVALPGKPKSGGRPPVPHRAQAPSSNLSNPLFGNTTKQSGLPKTALPTKNALTCTPQTVNSKSRKSKSKEKRGRKLISRVDGRTGYNSGIFHRCVVDDPDARITEATNSENRVGQSPSTDWARKVGDFNPATGGYYMFTSYESTEKICQDKMGFGTLGKRFGIITLQWTAPAALSLLRFETADEKWYTFLSANKNNDAAAASAVSGGATWIEGPMSMSKKDGHFTVDAEYGFQYAIVDKALLSNLKITAYKDFFGLDEDKKALTCAPTPLAFNPVA